MCESSIPTGEGIEHISFRVAPGEFLTIVGPSGAGKTTVLRAIYLDLWPQEGSVQVAEYNSLFMKKREIPFVRRKLGIFFFRIFGFYRIEMFLRMWLLPARLPAAGKRRSKNAYCAPWPMSD
jgi:ABC-type ATPase involved in cell division